VFVAAEIVRGHRGEPGLTARAPWIVAFLFGLVHGLGFAGALSEVGLPETHVPAALVCFSLGVEIGHLLFIGAVGAVVALGRRLRVPRPAWAGLLPACGIGGVAALWLIERTVAP
jgi:hypothetical protein